mgnify:CR=1 FL=1
MGSVEALVHAWRDRIAELRRYGAEPQAKALESAADELAAALRNAAGEVLTLAQAATVSGYSRDQLRRLARKGKLRNLGRPYAPSFARADLPTKPGTLQTVPAQPIVAGVRGRIVRGVVTSSP